MGNWKIPRFYYDVFVKIMPGLFCVVGVSYFLTPSIPNIAKDIFGAPDFASKNPLYIICILLFFAFVTGSLIGTVSGVLESWLSYLFPRFFNVGYSAVKNGKNALSNNVVRFVSSVVPKAKHDDYSYYIAVLFEEYDKLKKINEHIAGSITRTRAEYRMYGGFFISTIILIVVYFASRDVDWRAVAAFAIVLGAFGIGFARGCMQFQRCVFSAAAREQEGACISDPTLWINEIKDNLDVSPPVTLAVIAHDKTLDAIRNSAEIILQGEIKAETPFGTAYFSIVEIEGRKVCLLPRYRKETRSEGRIAMKSQIIFLAAIGVEKIISFNGVGAISPKHNVGDYVLPDDLLDLSYDVGSSFYSNQVQGSFVRMNPPYCPSLRKDALLAAKKEGLSLDDHSTYASVLGPRLETPAEVKMLSQIGADIVSMRVGQEAALARELEMCYCPVCFILNPAESTGGTKSGASFHDLKAGFNGDLVDHDLVCLLRSMIENQSHSDDCACQHAMHDYVCLKDKAELISRAMLTT